MNRIRELREQKGWKQEELGVKINKAKSIVSRYETGGLGISDETICKLCDLFECTSDYLLCRSSSPSPVVTREEAELLRLFRAVSPAMRSNVIGILRESAPQIKSEVS